MTLDSQRKDDLNSLQVLQTARKFLDDYGWIQGDYGHEDIGFCAIGAIWTAVWKFFPRGTGEQRERGGRLAGRAAKQLKDSIAWPFSSTLASWNDEPGRTKEEVLALFDSAIATLEA